MCRLCSTGARRALLELLRANKTNNAQLKQLTKRDRWCASVWLVNLFGSDCSSCVAGLSAS